MAEVEKAAEALVGEVLEAGEEFGASNRFQLFIFGSTFVGFTIGAVAGHLVTKRLWQTKFDNLLNEETQKLREHYAAKAKAKETTEEKPSLDGMVERLGYGQPPPKENLVGVRPLPPPVVVEEAEVTVNVFNENQTTTDWDYAAEVKSRDPRFPYIIHRDEHRQNEREYEQVTLTYFDGDDILCDERDEVVDMEKTVGIENLSRFGHGSGDGNMLFVRNDVIEVDYEIVKSDGTYAQEVHGFEPPDIKHSERHFDDE